MARMNLAEMQSNALRAAALLKSMSNPSRLLVLCQLADGEQSVGDLERALGVSQSALSQHLALLRHQHIVATRREGQTIYYSLTGKEASAVLATLFEVFCRKAPKARSRRLVTRSA